MVLLLVTAACSLNGADGIAFARPHFQPTVSRPTLLHRRSAVLWAMQSSSCNNSNLIRVVGAVVLRDGRVFMAQRPLDKERGGLWEFPGGKVDSGMNTHFKLTVHTLVIFPPIFDTFILIHMCDPRPGLRSSCVRGHHASKGETDQEALARELREELQV